MKAGPTTVAWNLKFTEDKRTGWTKIAFLRIRGPAGLAAETQFISNEVMDALYSYGARFRNFLNKPLKVLLVCNVVFLAYLFLNGAVWRVWGLKRDQTTITEQIRKSKELSQSLDMQIQQAKDSSFIARQAKDKLDMVGENDLVFVFPD